jgi:hypothetical protein
MTVPNNWVLYYMHEKEELYDLELLKQFFIRLSERNCYVASESEIASLAVWRKYLVNAPAFVQKRKGRKPFDEVLKLGVSEEVSRQTLVYVEERQEQLTVAIRSIARSSLVRGFEFTVTLAPAEGYILLSVEQERFFRPTLDGLAKYRYWIRVLEEVYACWHPLYAHEFTHQGQPSVNPSWEDVHELKIPALYGLNIYGPELVQQMDKERLLEAPAWLVKELEGSGCLLVPIDQYGLSASSSYTYDDVAKYLGFPQTI